MTFHTTHIKWRNVKSQVLQYNFICISFLILLLLHDKCYASMDNKNVPCKFLDSVNITDGIRNPDGSILYDNITYAKGDYGRFDYEFLNESYRQPTESHLRGCICRFKPCVRLCCPRGEYYNQGCNENNTVIDLSIDIILRHSNKTITTDLFEYFHYVTGKPCSESNELTPEEYEDDKWEMLDNGVVQGVGRMYTKNEYCLNPKYMNTSDLVLRLVTCFEPAYDLKYSVMPYGMIISVPFLVATFLVYAILPELRNVHGKSLMCYLFGLAVGYSTLAYIQLDGGKSLTLDNTVCVTLGYTTYFSFMSAFFWLNVISFDLWWNFRGMRSISKSVERKKFLGYSLYAWGTSISLLLLCILLDRSSSVPSKWQPAIGIESCFIRANTITQFLYFYLPIIIIVCSNSIFFTMTFLKIRKVQMEMKRIIAKEDSKRHQTQLDNEKDNFGLFFRLFIVMGVTWSMEALSYVIDPNSWVFYLSDFANTVQGIVIFILFVMKKKVKRLIIKRWYLCRGIPVPKGMLSYSGTTRTSNVISMNTVSQTEKSLINDPKN